MKRCAACHLTKPRSEFQPSKRWRDGCYPYCYKCCRLRYQQKHGKPEVQQPALNRLNETESAYIAGIIDGEGNVSIFWTNSWCISVRVSNTDRRLMDWLVKTVGYGYIQTKRPGAGNHKPCLAWDVKNGQAIDLLAQVRPWLVLKHRQSEIAEAFWHLRAAEKTAVHAATGRLKWKMPRQLTGPAHELLSEIHLLNRRGVHHPDPGRAML